MENDVVGIVFVAKVKKVNFWKSYVVHDADIGIAIVRREWLMEKLCC